MLFAVGALAVSGVLAPMLAISRAPGMEAYLPWAEQAFQRAIIEHVVFSVVVWMLAVFGGLLTIAAYDGGRTPKAAPLGRIALWLMAPAFVLLFVPGVLTSAEPSLNNYVPVMIHPLYYAGLIVLFAALGLVAVRRVLNWRADAGAIDGTGAGAVVYTMALVAFFLAWATMGDTTPSLAYNEDLFWGGGHILQVLNALLLLIGWTVLAGRALGAPLVGAKVFRAAMGLGVLAGLGVLGLYAFYPIDGGGLADMQSKTKFLLVAPTGLVGLTALPVLAKAARADAWKNPAFVAMALSMMLFAVGGVMGYFADGTDTKTPGHYHAVLGGVNLAFFGLVMFHFLPLLGRALKPGRWPFIMLYTYAAGQALQSAGMFIAAAPRKTMGQAQMLETTAEKLGMQMNQNGALIAVIGGILFVLIAGRALLKKTPETKRKFL